MFKDRAPRICSGGLVYCPLRRGDTALDSCLSCEWIERVDTRREDDAPLVHCTPPRRPVTTDAGWIA